MADDEINAILAATAAALNPSPDISGCPDTVAMLASATVLRAAAEWVEDIRTYRDLRRWADAIDDRATSAEPGTHWSTRLDREAAERASADTAPNSLAVDCD